MIAAYEAYWLSIKLGLLTTLILLPFGYLIARHLSLKKMRYQPVIETLVMLPLVLPPTVIGFYLLTLLSPESIVGSFLQSLTGSSFVFSFPGLVLASVIINLPFAVQPIQQALRAIPSVVFDAAEVSGMNRAQRFFKVELPLCWPGILCAAMLTFAHTLGEFGVVLMVGGNIEGRTRTVSIAIYDSVQAFDYGVAGIMTIGLLLISVIALVLINYLGRSRRIMGGATGGRSA